MAFTTLISVAELKDLRQNGTPCMVFDCTFNLSEPEAGQQQYLEAHVPDAFYVHLDRDLSAKKGGLSASGGRHPLPTRETFAQRLGEMGFGNDMQAVVYDRNGANYCGRMWWMLKWLGHENVAVLDGGLQAWQAAGETVTDQLTNDRVPTVFMIGLPLVRLVRADEVQALLGQSDQTLVDARGPERYRGDVEPMDPVAGHIPGALNRPFSQNMGADGRFKPAGQLRSEFLAMLGERAPQSVVHQCGSGVSAVPNIIAMEVAGLGPTALFAGSWSEWCSDPSRPVEQGKGN